MKIKPAQKTGGVIVELGRGEAPFSSIGEESAMAGLANFHLRKILVPVDFTRCTEKAMVYAVPFAREFEAELTLLHVVTIPRSMGFDSGAIPEMEAPDEAWNELGIVRDRFAREIPCERVVRTGIPSHEIVSAAKEFGSDLIILATHGRTGLERLVMGSTAEKVVRYASCPVLVVRETEHEFIVGSAAN